MQARTLLFMLLWYILNNYQLCPKMATFQQCVLTAMSYLRSLSNKSIASGLTKSSFSECVNLSHLFLECLINQKAALLPNFPKHHKYINSFLPKTNFTVVPSNFHSIFRMIGYKNCYHT